MASKKIERGSEEWQMFTDFWSICQKYWEPEQADEYWENLIRDFDQFHKKYGTPFSKNLTIAILNALEEIEKERRK